MANKMSECQMAPQLRIFCGQHIPFSLTRQFSEEEGSLYPVQFTFLYKKFHEKLNRALYSYIESWLPSCYRQAQVSFISEKYGHHSGRSLDDKVLFDRSNTQIVGSNPKQLPIYLHILYCKCIHVQSGFLRSPDILPINSAKFLQYLKIQTL